MNYRDDDDALMSPEQVTLRQPPRSRAPGGAFRLSSNDGGTQRREDASPTESTPASGATTPLMPASWSRAYFVLPWEAMHAQPLLLTLLITTSVFLPITALLQHAVLDANSHLSVFLSGSVFIFLCYEVSHWVLNRLSSSFQRLSASKKMYAISNMIKFGVLASIAPLAMKQLWVILLHDEWNSNTLRNLGCIYSIPDFVSLVRVRRMAVSTIVHHVCVVLFNVASIHTDYSKPTVCRLIVVYAGFSTLSYLVPGLLSSRFLGNFPATASRSLAASALAVNVSCLSVNWGWQCLEIRALLSSPDTHRGALFLYMICVAFVIYDDIALCLWLLRNVRARRATALQQAPQSVLLRVPPAATDSAPQSPALPRAQPAEPSPATSAAAAAVVVAEAPANSLPAAPRNAMAPIRVAKRRGNVPDGDAFTDTPTPTAASSTT